MMRIRHPITPEEHAQLMMMRDEVLRRLTGDGLTAGWLAERSGVGVSQVRQWLNREFKGYWMTKGLAVYRLPTISRKDNIGKPCP